MEKKTTKRQLECLGRRWTMINYTTHDKTFICICTKFSREDEDKLPNDSHSFAPGCFFLLDRRRHKSDLAMPWGRHRVLRLLRMVFNILLPLCNSVDGWSLLGGFLIRFFLATISGYVCLNYSTSTIMMCKGSMIMIGGLWSKCHPKRTLDRQTDGCGSLASSFVPFWVHYHVYQRNVFLEDIPHYSDSSYPTVPRVPIHAGG